MTTDQQAEERQSDTRARVTGLLQTGHEHTLFFNGFMYFFDGFRSDTATCVQDAINRCKADLRFACDIMNRRSLHRILL